MKSRNPCAESKSAPPRLACALPNNPNFMESASPFDATIPSGCRLRSRYRFLSPRPFAFRVEGQEKGRPHAVNLQELQMKGLPLRIATIAACLLVPAGAQAQHLTMTAISGRPLKLNFSNTTNP